MDPVALLIQAETILGPAPAWAGRCFEIADGLAKHVLKQDHAVAVYGHYLGPVHKRSYFGKRKGHPFVRHGWVLLGNGTIIDPTRWAFEAQDPYIAIVGQNDVRYGEYDEGGNEWLKTTLGQCPHFDSEEETYDVSPQMLPSDPFALVEKLIKPDLSQQEPGTFTKSQLMWLAHVPYSQLGKHAPAIYEALQQLGLGAFIPIDNQLCAKRAAAQAGKKGAKR